MFLLGGAATGVWLASTGLVRVDQRFVLELSGDCSFCGKSRNETWAIVGVPGRHSRICDECVHLCCDILGEEAGYFDAPRTPNEPQLDEARLAEILRCLQ